MQAKSPGGSVFPYYYKGGEIHALKYGSFYADEAAVIRLMAEEEAFLNGFTARRFRVWTDFYKTTLTGSLAEQYVAHIGRMGDKIIKMAIAGVSPQNRRLIKKLIRKAENFPPYAFFSDPEDAKTWLVSDGA